jgi:transposase
VIDEETRGQIVRYRLVEKWSVSAIARHFGIHHSTVTTALLREGLPPAALPKRPSIADPYLPFIREQLGKHPDLLASRLYEMVRERGYPGRPDHFRTIVRKIRPKPPAEAYLRLRTLPGEQAQVDWAHFGKVRVGGALRFLAAFIMVLSWCRMIFLRFFYDMRLGAFLRGHIEAFAFFGGVPRVVLYDNLKSVVLERRADAIRFHPELLAFARHYRYEPRPVAIARGNEKGRVERAIRFARDSFFAAREWKDLEDLNAQARAWCLGIAADRKCPEDRTLTVRQAFENERPRLLPEPHDAWPAADRVEVAVRKQPYVRFDLNDYSIPHDRVRRTLTVVATEQRVRILDGNDQIAEHARCWDRDQQIEDPAHVEALTETKKAAREQRATDRLLRAAPRSQELLRVLAERGANIGWDTARLVRLLDEYGGDDLDAAIGEVLARETPHLHAIRQVLDRMRHERGLPPPVPVSLPNDPRVRDIVVKPHELAAYDALSDEEDGDER